MKRKSPKLQQAILSYLNAPEASGKTQEEIADLFEVSQSYVSKLKTRARDNNPQ